MFIVNDVTEVGCKEAKKSVVGNGKLGDQAAKFIDLVFPLSQVHYLKEIGLQLPCQHRDRQLSQKQFQEASNGVGIVVLSRCKEVIVALCKVKDSASPQKRAVQHTHVELVFETFDHVGTTAKSCRISPRRFLKVKYNLRQTIKPFFRNSALGLQILNASEDNRREFKAVLDARSLYGFFQRNPKDWLCLCSDDSWMLVWGYQVSWYPSKCNGRRT